MSESGEYEWRICVRVGRSTIQCEQTAAADILPRSSSILVSRTARELNGSKENSDIEKRLKKTLIFLVNFHIALYIVYSDI